MTLLVAYYTSVLKFRSELLETDPRFSFLRQTKYMFELNTHSFEVKTFISALMRAYTINISCSCITLIRKCIYFPSLQHYIQTNKVMNFPWSDATLLKCTM